MAAIKRGRKLAEEHKCETRNANDAPSVKIFGRETRSYETTINYTGESEWEMENDVPYPTDRFLIFWDVVDEHIDRIVCTDCSTVLEPASTEEGPEAIAAADDDEKRQKSDASGCQNQESFRRSKDTRSTPG